MPSSFYLSKAFVVTLVKLHTLYFDGFLPLRGDSEVEICHIHGPCLNLLHSRPGVMGGSGTARASVGGASLPGTAGYFPGPGASETDGETYDDVTDDFGEFDEWDYAEMLATLYADSIFQSALCSPAQPYTLARV
jgi:hypothetical protein